MLRRRPRNFAVNLRSGDKRNFLCKSDIEALIKCKAEPESVEVRPSNLIVASLFYRRWVEAVVWLWGSRRDRIHNLLPEPSPKVSVPPHHHVKLEERLFSDRIKRLIDGEIGRDWSRIHIPQTRGLLSAAIFFTTRTWTLECERKCMSKECLEKCFYHGSGGLPPIALFVAGADIKHLGLLM